MSADPSDPSAADPSAADPSGAESRAAAPQPITAALVRLGRWIDRGNLLTLGGWGLFAASTVFAAALAGPPPSAGPANAELADSASSADADADADDPTAASPEPAATEALPVRVASLPGAAPLRHWPAPPEDYKPPTLGDSLPPAAAVLSDPPGPLPQPAPVAPSFELPLSERDGTTDVWEDVLSDLPPAAADDLNAMRQQFGSIVPFAPPATAAPLPVVPAEPIVEPTADLAPLRAALAAARANLAGALTPGYRRVEPTGPNGALRVNLAPGPLTETGRPLDLALTGPGWFEMLGDDPEAPPTLTRVGSFCVHDGVLAFAAYPDRPVRGERGKAITVSDDLIGLAINSTGIVYGERKGEDGEVVIGRVVIVSPADAAMVEPLGGALYRPIGPAWPVPGVDSPKFTAEVGYLEGANVDAAEEMARVDVIHEALRRLGERN